MDISTIKKNLQTKGVYSTVQDALKDIDLANPENSITLGQIVEFVQPFSTWSAGGEIRIGNVLIDTDYTEVEEELEEEY